MTEICEGIFIAVDTPEEQEEEQDEEETESVSIRFCVFFDGTLNNRTNINQRLAASPVSMLTKEERKNASELKMTEAEREEAKETYKEHGAKKEGEENSYEGYYTNVVKMERHIDNDPNYDLTLTTYIEGAGSMDKVGDKTAGYAFAIWESGLKAKVKKAVLDVVNKIKQNQSDKEVIIKKLTLDVFGFSRGAAEARNFIHEALKGDENEPIKNLLVDKGYQVKKVEVCFVGLYDTVSTYGLWVAVGAANNVKGLNLNAIRRAKKVLHLAAADEHRKYFSLTNINSAGCNGLEIFLPGVHSDIGGGYRDNANEKQIIFDGTESAAARDRDQLIKAGWYKDDEIKLIPYEAMEDNFENNAELSVNRSGISSQYSRIPLHIMTRYARENKIVIKTQLDDDENVPSELSTVQKKIESYIKKVETGRSKVEDWSQNKNEWLHGLRHDYCHFSAHCVMGHEPRLSFWRGERNRKTYDG